MVFSDIESTSYEFKILLNYKFEIQCYIYESDTTCILILWVSLFFYTILYFDSIQLVLSSFYATDAIARWFSLWLLLSRKDHHHLPWWGFQSQRFWSSSFTKNVYVLHSLLLALLCWVMTAALCDKIPKYIQSELMKVW